jgi:hypothetical protein
LRAIIAPHLGSIRRDQGNAPVRCPVLYPSKRRDSVAADSPAIALRYRARAKVTGACGACRDGGMADGSERAVPMEQATIFADLLRAARHRAHRTQQDMARAATPRSLISELEHECTPFAWSTSGPSPTAWRRRRPVPGHAGLRRPRRTFKQPAVGHHGDRSVYPMSWRGVPSHRPNSGSSRRTGAPDRRPARRRSDRPGR